MFLFNFRGLGGELMRQAGRSEQLRLRLVGPPWGGESTSLLSTLRGWRAGPPHPRVAALLRHTLRVLEALVFGSCRLCLYEGLQGHQPLGGGWGGVPVSITKGSDTAVLASSPTFTSTAGERIISQVVFKCLQGAHMRPTCKYLAFLVHFHLVLENPGLIHLSAGVS